MRARLKLALTMELLVPVLARRAREMVPFALAEACSASGAGFEPATSGHQAPTCPVLCSPDYESGALARLGYPGFAALSNLH